MSVFVVTYHLNKIYINYRYLSKYVLGCIYKTKKMLQKSLTVNHVLDKFLKGELYKASLFK